MGLSAFLFACLSVLFCFLRACIRQRSEAEAPSSQTRSFVIFQRAAGRDSSSCDGESIETKCLCFLKEHFVDFCECVFLRDLPPRCKFFFLSFHPQINGQRVFN